MVLIVRAMPPVFAGGVAVADTLRAYYYDRLWRSWSGPQRALALALNGTPPFGQSDRRAWRLGFRRRNLAEIDARRRPDAPLAQFLDQDERKGIHAIINRAGLPLETNPLRNKARFETRCRGAGLPLPATIEQAADAEHFTALIAKPAVGSKGRGVRRFQRESDGSWRASDGGAGIARDGLAGWLGRQRSEGNIVQQWMAPHPSLAAISPGALPTLRVVTVRNEAGRPEITDTALRLSLAATRAADNFNIDNLVVPVGAGDGRLGPALRRAGRGFSEHATHPLTGAPIDGCLLEQYQSARALALAAHAHFADHVVIGWDIGLAADGPVLIEGNWNPGYNVLQLVQGVGFGALRIGALYRYHLEQAETGWIDAAPLQLAQQRSAGR